MKIILHNQNGEEIGKVELPKDFFEVEMNPDLVHQVIVAQNANARKVLAHTKDRGEVSGGGKKPWRQKGTGRARHGSIRSPIWKGGGVCFGPTKERVFSKKINKKMKQKALMMGLSSKVKDKEIVLLDRIELTQPKTKIVFEIIKNLGNKLEKKLTKGSLIVLPETDQNIIRSTRNIPKMKIIRADSLNTLDILSYKYLIIIKESIKVMQKTYLH